MKISELYSVLLLNCFMKLENGFHFISILIHTFPLWLIGNVVKVGCVLIDVCVALVTRRRQILPSEPTDALLQRHETPPQRRL